MADVKLVVGLGYGDEGKGSVVDHLARLYGAHTVVRFCGGAQCAHNVVDEDGRHHTFSQYGSGTFAGARTHLSRHMLLNPVTMLSEGRRLHRVGVSFATDLVTIEREALVTNPFQIVANRLRELARNKGRHGSCGLGIGETVADHVDHGLTIFAGDLEDPAETRRKLVRSQEHKREQLAELVAPMLRIKGGGKAGPTDVEQQWEHLTDPSVVDWSLTRFTEFARLVQFVGEDYLQGVLDGPGTVLFEGAQGVLLDQDYGTFPYVTRSKCTFENALDLLDGRPATRLGVLRSYMTRHGAGPFVTENKSVEHPELHNRNDPWQQGWRQGHLDLVALDYAVRAVGGVDEIVVTHMDRLSGPQRVCTAYDMEWPLPVVWEEKARLRGLQSVTEALFEATPSYTTVDTADELLSMVSDVAGAPITITSHGPTAGDKHEARHESLTGDVQDRRGRAARQGRSVRPLPLHV